MSFSDKPNSSRNLKSSTEKKGKRQGSGCFQRRCERHRAYRSQHYEDSRLADLAVKYDLGMDVAMPVHDGHDLIISYGSEVLAHFAWDDDDSIDIPEGTVKTANYHVCFHSSPLEEDRIEQLDGIFDPEPWRFRSDSVGSDCSILDIRERVSNSEDDDEMGEEPVSLEVPPCLHGDGSSQDHQSVEVGPSISTCSLESYHPSILPSWRTASPIYERTDEFDTGTSSPKYAPMSPIWCAPADMETSEPNKIQSTSTDRVSTDYTSPLRVRLRSGKQIGIDRPVIFRVKWKDRTFKLRHQACFIKKSAVTTDQPVKIVLTRDCCLEAMMHKFPDALIIAVVGAKALGNDAPTNTN